MTKEGMVLPHLGPAGDGDPAVTIELHLGSAVATRRDVEDDRVILTTERAAAIIVEREPARISMHFPNHVTAEAMVHPLLTIPMSVLARWRGDVTLHGGAFHHAGASWGVVGERTAGKSSMLGVLGDSGIPIAADDLLVVDDGSVRAGPRCVDLRPDVGARIPASVDMGVVGNRPRWRLATPAPPARSPLRGFFLLEWHDEPGPVLEPVSTAERLQVLYRQEAIALMGFAAPQAFLELVGLPMWRLRRRADWNATSRAVQALLDATEAQAERLPTQA